MFIKFNLIILFCFVSIIFGQELNTDRPDFTTSPTIVPQNKFQIELGTFAELDQKIKNWNIADNLFRYGLSKDLELRMATTVTKILLEDDYFETGISNLNFGVKYRFLNNSVQLAYIGALTIPVGNENFTNGKLGLNNILALQHNIGDDLELCYNIGFNYFSESENNLTYSLISSYSLFDELGVFTEFYGELNKFKNNFSFFDAGVTYLLLPNLQLDVSSGLGLTEKYYFFSTGFTIRFPN